MKSESLLPCQTIVSQLTMVKLPFYPVNPRCCLGGSDDGIVGKALTKSED